jgi:hypothetical protein
MKRYFIIVLLIFNFVIINSAEIKLQFKKEYLTTTNKSYINKIDNNSVLITNTTNNNSFLINNINNRKEKVIKLSTNSFGRYILLNKNIFALNSNEENIYIFESKENTFVKGYKFNNMDFNIKDNSLFYQNDFISNIFMKVSFEDDDFEIISADNADEIKSINSIALFRKEYSYEYLNDLWLYDGEKKSYKILSDNTIGYFIISDNLFFILRNKGGFENIEYEYYLIDSQGYIQGKYGKDDFNNLYFTSGEIIDNKYLILSGKDDKHQGILLYEFKICENSINKEHNKIITNNILLQTSVNNLRLRSEPSLKSKVIFSLPKNEWVRIIEYGDKETIDGVTGKWVKVFTKQFVGWCFDAYLEELK